MTLTATEVTVKNNPDWLDCSLGAVKSGISKSNNGQITRLYYESYGNPAEDPGNQDGGTPHRRMITLRAIDVIPFKQNEKPTVVFVDDNGTSFYLTQLNKIKDQPSFEDPVIEDEMRKRSPSEILTIQHDNELVPIGVNVALAIPDNKVMSPQLRN